MRIKKIIIFINLIFIILTLTSCKNNNALELNLKFNIDNFDGIYDEYSYKYSDSYFYSNEYNLDLLKTSFIINYSSFSNEYDGKDETLKKIMQDMEFSDFYSNSYSFDNADIKNMSLSFASKDILIKNKNYKLICVIAKGYDYFFEWVSNFVMGSDGDHLGFKESAITLINELNNYAEMINAKDTILWITGYSRGGAVSNLATAYIENYINYKNTNNWLIDEYKIDELNFSVELNNIFCYTFDAPKAALIKNRNALNNISNNIYNFINSSDIVPMIVPEEFGFRRYGIDKIYDLNKDDNLLSKLNENYKFGYNNYIDEYAFSLLENNDSIELKINDDFILYINNIDVEITMEEYFNDLISYLISIFQTRKNYSDIIDDMIVEIFSNYANLKYSDKIIFINSLIDNLENMNLMNLIFYKNISKIISSSFEDVNVNLTDNCIKKIDNFSKIIINEIISLLDSEYFGATLYINLSKLINNHYPYLLFSIINSIE